MVHTLEHLSSSGVELDSKVFYDENGMQNYIDTIILPYWVKGDVLVCDGVISEHFYCDDFKDEDKC